MVSVTLRRSSSVALRPRRFLEHRCSLGHCCPIPMGLMRVSVLSLQRSSHKAFLFIFNPLFIAVSHDIFLSSSKNPGLGILVIC